jgi:hypothetical protein
LPLRRGRRYRSLTVSILLHLNGNIGTYDGAGRAARAFFAVIKSGNIISLEVQITGNINRTFRAEFNTETTAFAAFPIYVNRAFQSSCLSCFKPC